MNERPQSILIFKGQSKYNVLRIAADNVSQALTEKGYHCIIYDLCAESSDRLAMDITDILNQNSVVMLFSFNLLLCELFENDVAPWNILAKIPYVSYLVDHPMYQDFRLMSAKNASLYLYTFDYDNVSFIKQNYGWIKKVEFLHIPGFISDFIPAFQDKKIDVIFNGSYCLPKNLYNSFSSYPEAFRPAAERITEIILDHPDLSVEKALDFYLNELNFQPTTEDKKAFMLALSQVDALIRGYFRDQLIRTLLTHGIKVCVFGSGWETFESQYADNLVILGDGDLMEGISYMAKAKIVVGMIPWFKNGIQDRIITTMLNHSICVTDRTPYLEQHLTDYEDVIFYDINHLEELPEKITKLLQDPEKMQTIAENGFQTASRNYSMDLFVTTILEVIH